MADPHPIADYALSRKLQNTTDASVWTDEFMRLVEAGMVIDWGTMVGWFANAIEVGREAGRKQSDGLATGGIVSEEAAKEIGRSIGQYGCVIQPHAHNDGKVCGLEAP